MTWEEWVQVNGLFVFQLFVLLVQVYLTYRTDQGRLKYDKISEKVNLNIKPYSMDCQEYIDIINEGLSSVDETIVDIDVVIFKRKSDNILVKYKWKCVNLLNSKEKITINLYEKLMPKLIENNIIYKNIVEIPTEIEDEYGNVITYDQPIYHLKNIFDIKMTINVNAKIYGEVKKIQKTFNINYDWVKEAYDVPPKDFQYENDYESKITEIFGEWE